MIDISRQVIFSLCASVCLLLAACGGGSDDVDVADGAGMSGSGDFDESQLPADFPKDLIPGDYDSGVFTTLGQVQSAVFENRTPVGDTIDRYVELLGKPEISSDAGDGDRTVQWHTKPWALSIIGNDGESIVSFSRIN